MLDQLCGIWGINLLLNVNKICFCFQRSKYLHPRESVGWRRVARSAHSRHSTLSQGFVNKLTMENVKKQIEVKFWSKLIPWVKANWACIWYFMLGLLSYLVFTKLLYSGNFPSTSHHLIILHRCLHSISNFRHRTLRICFYFHFFKMCVVVAESEIIENLYYI